MDTQYISVCERMKQYRINYPMTQSELAGKSGLSARSISRFENGEDISLSAFIKLLRALDLDDRLLELIPDQTVRPSYYLINERMRSRASKKKSNGGSKPFVWGDEK